MRGTLIICLLSQFLFGQNNDSMKKYKVVNESLQYSLYSYDEDKNGKLPEKYWKKPEKRIELKNGDIGTIEIEYDHSNGFKLVIIKIDGFENRFHVIAKSALGELDSEIIPMPSIEWYDLPKETDLYEIELKGKVVAYGDVIEFKLNHDYINLNKSNEFKYKYKMNPGRNQISFYISTGAETSTFDNITIQNISNVEEKIFKSLRENNFFKFIDNNSITKEEENRIKSNLKEGYFYPPSFDTYYDVEGESLVEDGFKWYLSGISKGLMKRDCKVEIGEEFQSYNPNKKSKTGEQYWTHWIEVNQEKEIIFQGFLGETDFTQIYFEKLVDIINKSLKSGNRPETVKLIGSYDGVMICLLTDKEFELLKSICTPLKNKFIK